MSIEIYAGPAGENDKAFVLGSGEKLALVGEIEPKSRQRIVTVYDYLFMVGREEEREPVMITITAPKVTEGQEILEQRQITPGNIDFIEITSPWPNHFFKKIKGDPTVLTRALIFYRNEDL